MKEVIYIKESAEFIVNGKTIKEQDLTESEKNELKKLADEQRIITGDIKDNTENIIV